tara:strand:+ start:897 stop:1097 length:201 start_codon:yes stop_codon:yes gene_type:complete
MNELDRIVNDVNKLAKSIFKLKMLDLYATDELETLEDKGLKEICARSKHMIDDFVYSTHRDTIEAL